MTKMGSDCTGHGLGPNPGGQGTHMKDNKQNHKAQKPINLKMDYNHTKFSPTQRSLRGKRQ